MSLVTFAGQKQTGKTTSANYVVSRFREQGVDFHKNSFAAALKHLFCQAFNVDEQFILEWRLNPEIPPGFDMQIRKALQFVGDGFRQIKKNIWIESVTKHLKDNTAIDDGRYFDELRKTRELGGIVVLLYREGYLNDDPNASEAELRPLIEWFYNTGKEGALESILEIVTEQPPTEAKYVDFFIRNDGTLEELYAKIERYVLPALCRS